MKDKEKQERKNNIVLKGIRMEEDEKTSRTNIKIWVEKLNKKKIRREG